MKVFVTQPQHSKLQHWEVNRVPYIRRIVAEAISAYPDLSLLELSDTPEKADIIVMLESCIKTPNYIDELAQEEIIHLKPFRVYTLNYDDQPLGFLPGLYTSLDRQNFDAQYHLSWPYLNSPNYLVDNYIVQEDQPSQNSLLFTFSGSCTHPLRRRIFSTYSQDSDSYRVVEVDWRPKHDENGEFNYMQDILRSKYVLCPRGVAPYSHRIFETITLGKVPVIIADDWIPFSIPETGYYIQIQEKDILDIPIILQNLESSYEDMISKVNFVRKKYFLKPRKYAVAIAQLANLHSRIDPNLTYDLLAQRFLK